MSKLSDILDSGLFVDEEGNPDYRTGKVRRQVKDLILELLDTCGNDLSVLKERIENL